MKRAEGKKISTLTYLLKLTKGNIPKTWTAIKKFKNYDGKNLYCLKHAEEEFRNFRKPKRVMKSPKVLKECLGKPREL